jgi:hypothetical protein
MHPRTDSRVKGTVVNFCSYAIAVKKRAPISWIGSECGGSRTRIGHSGFIVRDGPLGWPESCGGLWRSTKPEEHRIGSEWIR